MENLPSNPNDFTATPHVDVPRLLARVAFEERPCGGSATVEVERRHHHHPN
jgi:hypothetical protein